MNERTSYTFTVTTLRSDDDDANPTVETVTIEGELERDFTTRTDLLEPFFRLLAGVGYGVDDLREDNGL